jgi:hypothetical protein
MSILSHGFRVAIHRVGRGHRGLATPATDTGDHGDQLPHRPAGCPRPPASWHAAAPRDRCLGAENVWRVATLGSVRALSPADQAGLLAPGRKVDIGMLRADSTFLCPLSTALGSLVYAETGAAAHTVRVGSMSQTLGLDGRDQARILYTVDCTPE